MLLESYFNKNSNPYLISTSMCCCPWAVQNRTLNLYHMKSRLAAWHKPFDKAWYLRSQISLAVDSFCFCKRECWDWQTVITARQIVCDNLSLNLLTHYIRLCKWLAVRCMHICWSSGAGCFTVSFCEYARFIG